MKKLSKLFVLLALALMLMLVASACSDRQERYTVTFNTDNGSAIAQFVKEGGKVVRPAQDPTKTGYTFHNWYKDPAKLLLFDFDGEIVRDNITIYAFWLGTDGLEYSPIKGGTEFSVSKGTANTNGDIYIQDYYLGRPVTRIGDEAFLSCDSITSIAIPDTVTSIGFAALGGCSSLTSISIPNSVTSIDFGALGGCSSLTSISIPNSVTSIDFGAFTACRNLTSINVDEANSNYSSNGGVLFNKNKTTLICYPAGKTASSYEIPSTVTSIGEWALSACDNLTSVTIPNSVINIGDYAFFGCKDIANVTIGSGITSIGSYAFFGCSKLSVMIKATTPPTQDNSFSNAKAIIVPYSSLDIYKSSWLRYSSMIYSDSNIMANDKYIITNGMLISYFGSSTTVIVPDIVTDIGSFAFRDCDSLTSVIIPNNIVSIGEGAFLGCNSLESISLPFVGNTLNGTSNTHFGYIFGASSNTSNSSYIPTSLKTVTITGVTSIGALTFYECNGLESIIISNNVTSIEKSAFFGCNSLESISLPFVGNTLDGTSNTHFGYIFGASSHTSNSSYVPTSLKTVTITGVTSIANWAFYNCDAIASIIIGDGVTSIGTWAFDYCISLVNVSIGDGMTSISSTFNGTGIWENTVNNSIVYVDRWAVGYKGTISDNTLRDDIVGIGNYAFARCNDITSITIPNDVTIIGMRAFSTCEALISVTIGSNVTSIGSAAFDACSNLTSINVDETNSNYSSINGVLFNKNKTTLICYPAGKTASLYEIPSIVTSIGEWALSTCDNLTSVTIPNSVTSIGEGAFFNCSKLTSVTIPNSVTSIGDDAFTYCIGLISIIIPNGVTSIGERAFYGCDSLTSVIFENANDWFETFWSNYWHEFNAGRPVN